MRLHLLGTGTPVLDLQRQATTAILIEIGPERVLFDAGRGVTTQLLKQNIDPTTVGTLFITHHHYDHICNLGEFLLSVWHNGRIQPIHVLGPAGTSTIVTALLNQVYARDIAFALFNEPDIVDIRQLVKAEDVLPGLVYESNDWRVFAEYVNHGNSLGLSETEWPCLGYRLECNGKAVTIGGDTVACDGLDSFVFAQYAFADPNRVILEDLTHSTKDEKRYYCLGKVGEGILTVRFTYRECCIRIFGAGYWRKGRRIYEEQNQL